MAPRTSRSGAVGCRSRLVRARPHLIAVHGPACEAASCTSRSRTILANYRDNVDIPRLGAGFGIAQATSYRYVAEGREVIAAEAPDLDEALERAVNEGTPYVILDGKVVLSDRCHEKKTGNKGTEIDAWYSGKKKDFGGNIQALMYPDGIPMWISGR